MKKGDTKRAVLGIAFLFYGKGKLFQNYRVIFILWRALRTVRIENARTASQGCSGVRKIQYFVVIYYLSVHFTSENHNMGRAT